MKKDRKTQRKRNEESETEGAKEIMLNILDIQRMYVYNLSKGAVTYP